MIEAVSLPVSWDWQSLPGEEAEFLAGLMPEEAQEPFRVVLAALRTAEASRVMRLVVEARPVERDTDWLLANTCAVWDYVEQAKAAVRAAAYFYDTLPCYEAWQWWQDADRLHRDALRCCEAWHWTLRYLGNLIGDAFSRRPCPASG
jgi:hypothetical protein